MCRKYIKKIIKLVKDLKGDLVNRQKDNNVRMQAIPKLIYKLDAISIKIPLEFILYSLCIACLFWNSSRVERKNHKRLLRDIYATIC